MSNYEVHLVSDHRTTRVVVELRDGRSFEFRDDVSVDAILATLRAAGVGRGDIVNTKHYITGPWPPAKRR